MDLEIRALAPELAPDYFDFFENRAFTDGSPYRCYCQMFQASKAEAEAAYSGLASEELGRAARREAERQIREARYEWDYAGPVRLYEKAGFQQVAQGPDGELVLRKAL